MRERGEATEIVGVTIGPATVDEQIRSALAMGVDRAIRIDDARALDPYAVARILRALVEKEAPQLVLMGKQAVDDDSNQVGQMLAGLLGWPQATFISKIEFLENKTARAMHARDRRRPRSYRSQAAGDRHDRSAPERAALRFAPWPDEGAQETDRGPYLRTARSDGAAANDHSFDRASAEAEPRARASSRSKNWSRS